MSSWRSLFDYCKHIIRYLSGKSSYGLWNPKSTNIVLKGFSNADYAGDKVYRKSTSSTSQFIKKSLVSWNRKKQNCISLSTTESKYIIVGLFCVKILWMSHQLSDYNLCFKLIKIFCDNSCIICLSKNLVHYSRVK